MMDGIHAVDNLVLSKDEMADFAVNVYPNPASNTFYIETNGNAFSYQLMDVSGTVLEEGNSVSGSKKVDITNYFSGIYLVKISNGNRYRIVKR